MLGIVPNIWFDIEAEDAAKFYTSIFEDSKILNVSHYGEAGPRPAGMVLTVDFEIKGQRFTALNGGPDFKPNEAVSFLINCESQEEVDTYWERLGDGGGEPGPCGWIKDKFGVWWQVIPTRLEELITDQDAEKANRVMKAMLQMGKIEIKVLEDAHARA